MGLLLFFASSVFAQPPWFWEPPWKGPARGPQLGVFVDELSFDRLDALRLPYGVEVTRVIPGSPAEAGGLRTGDILLEINQQPVFSSARLRWLIGKADPEMRLELKYFRDGNTASLDITLQESQVHPVQPPHSPHQVWTSLGYLGASLQSLNKGLREAFSVPENVGVLVVEVYGGSAADRAGLRAGDVIVKMDRRTINNIGDVQRVLDYFEPKQSLKLEIIRDKQQELLEVTLGERKEPHTSSRWREWIAPYYQDPPFFVDPQWWREMQDRMRQWRYDWEGSWHKAPHGTL
jgi:S1-C subfamily serine protease